ncbi:LysE family translocator [Brevibacillus sp. SYSU BS000544]|uniref:LysE family translocator n=1 Tax=Brevibacillus sp. SYSU BS000544 TaxID=3416443 RepID=UPI003CE4D636
MEGIISFGEGLLFGMSLQLSIGPVCLTVLQLAMTEGYKKALQMVLGVTIVDALYIVAASLGMDRLLEIEQLRNLLVLLGGGLLIYFGISYLRSAGKASHHRLVKGNPFWYGVVLTLTNPLTILFWAGIFGALLASSHMNNVQIFSLPLFSLGCVFSTLLFLSLIVYIGKTLSFLFRPAVQKIFHLLLGLVFLFFGLRMLLLTFDK